MAQAHRAQAKMLAANGDASLDHIFGPNPRPPRRSIQANYTDVPIALHDGSSFANGFTSQWVGNRARRIEVEFLLHADGEKDVEAEIDRFERMLEKDPRTGEPPDMQFVFGQTYDLVRVESIEWDVILCTPQLQRQQVMAKMTLRVLTPHLPI